MNLTQATEKAIKASEHSDMKFHIGAVIFNKHRHVFGYNRKFDCVVQKHKEIFSIHAEEMAIVRASRIGMDLSNCEMVLLRINRNGDFRPITPCADCQRLINTVKLKKVYYIAEEV